MIGGFDLGRSGASANCGTNGEENCVACCKKHNALSIIEAWRVEHNPERRHISLGDPTLQEFATSRANKDEQRVLSPVNSNRLLKFAAFWPHYPSDRLSIS